MVQQLGKGIIVCIIDFGMVFLVMIGLQVALGIMRKMIERFAGLPTEGAPSRQAVESHAAPVAIPQPVQEQPRIAAITAAVQTFVGQPEGSFRIDYIEPLGERPAVAGDSQIAAVTAAVQAYTGLAIGQFRIDSIQPLDASAMAAPVAMAVIAPQRRAMRVSTDAWKLAGRLELMGMND